MNNPYAMAQSVGFANPADLFDGVGPFSLNVAAATYLLPAVGAGIGYVMSDDSFFGILLGAAIGYGVYHASMTRLG